MNNYDITQIPCGARCVSNGKLCPYYKKACVINLTRKNCKFKDSCTKNCDTENCKDIFVECKFKNEIENYASGKFLLAQKFKICGINLRKEN